MPSKTRQQFANGRVKGRGKPLSKSLVQRLHTGGVGCTVADNREVKTGMRIGNGCGFRFQFLGAKSSCRRMRRHFPGSSS